MMENEASSNIGPSEIRRRASLAIVMIILSQGLFIWMLISGANQWYYFLLLFLFIWTGALGYFQAREKT
jgi:hypothetical protein